MSGRLFSLKVFFVLLRETFESAIVISILLSFLRQNFDGASPLYFKLRLQVWLGAVAGLGICLLIGAVFVALFYLAGENYWSRYERVWEAVFSIASSIVISVMGLSLLRINQMASKWRSKLGKSIRTHIEEEELEASQAEAEVQVQVEHGANEDDNNNDSNNNNNDNNGYGNKVEKKIGFRAWLSSINEKYSLMILPMVTLLREGLEAIFVITGVTASEPVSALPLSILLAFLIGSLIGVSMYKGGNQMRLQLFLICATCLLYLVSAGLMSRGVWFLELEQYVQRCHGQDMTEVGNGPGSYDVENVVWHVNCCSGLTDGGWMLLNALVGWSNTATWGSIISYNLYWIVIITMLKSKLFQERHGYFPLIPIRWQLKKIGKRYLIIKYNLENNENYNSNSGSAGYNSFTSNDVELNSRHAYGHEEDRLTVIANDDDDDDDANDDESKATSSLLNSHRSGSSRSH